MIAQIGDVVWVYSPSFWNGPRTAIVIGADDFKISATAYDTFHKGSTERLCGIRLFQPLSETIRENGVRSLVVWAERKQRQ